MSIFERLNNWYRINCNNDWEHNYGIKIQSLDNPGWLIKIDLSETSLENARLHFEDEKSEIDWMSINIKEKIFIGACSINNLEKVIEIFFLEVLEKQIDKEFYYNVYIPINKRKSIFCESNSIMIDENTFKIKEILTENNGELKYLSKSDWDDKSSLTNEEIIICKEGEIVKCEIIQFEDGFGIAIKDEVWIEDKN